MIGALSRLGPFASRSNRTAEGSGIGDTEPDHKAFSGLSRSREAYVTVNWSATRRRGKWGQLACGRPLVGDDMVSSQPYNDINLAPPNLLRQ